MIATSHGEGGGGADAAFTAISAACAAAAEPRLASITAKTIFEALIMPPLQFPAGHSLFTPGFRYSPSTFLIEGLFTDQMVWAQRRAAHTKCAPFAGRQHIFRYINLPIKQNRRGCTAFFATCCKTDTYNFLIGIDYADGRSWNGGASGNHR
jgi:hypothetical protein